MVPVRCIFEAVCGAFRRRLEASRHSKGFVAVFCALFMGVLIIMAGFAIDIGNWYYHIQRMQRGADAAALGGSVYLPADYTTASAVATNILNENQLAADNNQIVQLPNHPTELQVTVTETVKSIFIEVAGLKSFTFTRTAVGEYRPYVPMGSPSNLLGEEPDPTNSWEKPADVGLQDHYWLNISAAGTSKANGDRYSGGICDSNTDGCTSATAPYGNVDYNPLGQAYIIRLSPGITTSDYLEVQAFDPEFANVGDNCTATTITLLNTPYNAALNPGMYTSGNDNPYCTGDNFNGSISQTPPPTTFALYTPDNSPGGSQLINVGSCSPQTFPGYNQNVISLLSTSNAFKTVFRKWVDVCDIPMNSTYPAGDYILRVSNSTSTNYNGLNRYAIRAGIVTSPGTLGGTGSTTQITAQTQKIALFSQGRLVVYAHDTSSNVTFFIAQVHSGSAGENMTITLFDIGDAAGTNSLTILPPSDGKTGSQAMTSYAHCQYTPPTSSAFIATSSGCTINNITSDQYNGRIVNVLIPIPSNYTCNDTSSDGCWTRLRLNYASTVNDTTSWEVSLDGNPVRLLTDAGT